MKKFLPLLLIGGASLHASDDFLWAKKELSMLRDGYKKYLAAPEQQRAGLDAALAELSPALKAFSLPGTGENREIPSFRFFILVDPVTGESSAPAEEKIDAAARDLGMLEAFTAMTSLLEQGGDEETLALNTQKLMLGWALRAADKKTPPIERAQLSSSFAFMVSEIGRRPGLLRLLPVYRTRRAFRLETPEAAADEAERMEILIKDSPNLNFLRTPCKPYGRGGFMKDTIRKHGPALGGFM